MLSDPGGSQDPGSSSLVAVLLEISLYLPGFHSLKEKRRVLRSLLEGTFPRFGAAGSEIAHQDHHERATLGAALVSGSPYELRHRADQFVEALKQDFRFQILSLKRTEVRL